MNDFQRSNNFRGDSNRGGGYPRRDYGRSSFGGGGRAGGRRTMHPATCSECGNKCEIPFIPRDDRPVYCSNCFEKRGNSNAGAGSAPRRFERNIPSAGNFSNNNTELKVKLDQINSKIDKLLNLLLPIAESEKALEAKTTEKVQDVVLEKKQEEELLVEKPVKVAKKTIAKKKKIVIKEDVKTSN
jgi:CxxC-x17-CxxC domain-containing protein